MPPLPKIALRLLGFALLSLIISVPWVAAQETVASHKLSAAEQKDLQEFARSFVKRLRETNSVEPLYSEFFVPRVAECIPSVVDADEDLEALQLTPDDAVRLFKTATDLAYIDSLAETTKKTAGQDSDYDPLTRIFPADLARRFKAAALPDEGNLDRMTRFNRLGIVEQLLREAREYLSTHSPPTIDLDDLKKYEVGSEINKEDRDSVPCKEVVPVGSRICWTTTPLTGMELAIVKRGNDYKIILAGGFMDD